MSTSSSSPPLDPDFATVLRPRVFCANLKLNFFFLRFFQFSYRKFQAVHVSSSQTSLEGSLQATFFGLWTFSEWYSRFRLIFLTKIIWFTEDYKMKSSHIISGILCLRLDEKCVIIYRIHVNVILLNTVEEQRTHNTINIYINCCRRIWLLL